MCIRSFRVGAKVRNPHRGDATSSAGPVPIWQDNPQTRFSEVSEDDLYLLRDGLIHRLPSLASSILEETEPGAQGASFGELADAVRIIQELDIAITTAKRRPWINPDDPERKVPSAEELKKMFEQLSSGKADAS